MAENSYPIGQDVGPFATFKDVPGPGGVLVDPTTVVCKLRAPDGTVTTHTFPGGDGVIVRDSLGNYHIAVATLQWDTYSYRWEGHPSPNCAAEGQFFIVRGAFAG